jgi:hypothetical protein
VRRTQHHGRVEASGPGGGYRDLSALPGVVSVTADDAASAAVTVEVDGETFALHPDEFDGTNYDWLSGPMPAMDSR